MSYLSIDRRSTRAELMDDLSIQDHRLSDALADIVVINRWLGGYSTSISAIEKCLRSHNEKTEFRILDIGSGAGDFAEAIIRWGIQKTPQLQISIVGLDYSPATVEWATTRAKSRLPEALASRLEFKVADAFDLESLDGDFDIVHCALFLHHFSFDQGVTLLRQMNRLGRLGIVVNDLHRHSVAHSSIKLLSFVLRASAMVRHDGPLSVRRAFTRGELRRLAAAAGLDHAVVTWHWAFRWLLTTVK